MAEGIGDAGIFLEVVPEDRAGRLGLWFCMHLAITSI